MDFPTKHSLSTRKKASRCYKRGKITLIKGTMFSGKTSELLSRVKKKQITNGNYILVKYALDTRYSNSGVASHSLQIDTNCISVLKCCEIEEKLNIWKLDSIFIDEGQFFPDLYDFCCKWMLRGKHITIAALEFYADQTPWPQIVKLAPLCEKVELNAICMICHGVATTCEKITYDLTNEVDIGGTDKYRAVCGACYLLEDVSSKIQCDNCNYEYVFPPDFDEDEPYKCESCFNNQ